MKVRAKKGRKCPREGKPRDYILDNATIEVADTAYYRRLVTDGSLVDQDKITPLAAAKPAAAKGGKD